MHTPHPSHAENLRYVAAGLIAAAGAHLLLCVATLPALMAAPAPDFATIAFKAAKVLWTLAGIAGAAFVGGHAFSLLGMRSHAQARLAALGALALPLVATNGAITAFALVPAGVIALVMLRRPEYRSAFPDGMEAAEPASFDAAAQEPTAVQAPARQPAWPVAG